MQGMYETYQHAVLVLCVAALVTALLFANNSRKHPELKLDAPSRK